MEQRGMNQSEKRQEAAAYSAAGLERVRNTSAPEGQMFPCGSRVRIADDLGDAMRHFPAGRNATVRYTYAHAYGGDDIKSYCLDIDGLGESSWYYEHQLALIDEWPDVVCA